MKTKQIYFYDGTPYLVIENKRGDMEFPKGKWTEIEPPEGIFTPCYFDGEKWIGTSHEEWLKKQPKVETEEIPDDKDVLISDLTLQLMKTQDTVANLQNDIANLTLQVLESDINA
ncbi:hypothetical protein F9B77_06445 [Staphylococcus epidermidis]|uniref:hypothetical protein n=1 Tax=Staphylococcus epidermidis TaxID=1282 RepID=UPI0007E407AC|nr:hypothetical protein [Staphylococcus epidermidis]KAB2157715.1 hypothetical protein F9B18_08575 [Staphylococcus epidermidis]KAB2309899.1 hypothetical protein F9B77_06445 [Staphylococcus epidermidis]MBM0818714.1 hypothetical protein [Staphylococcus epidermidis]MBM6146776.1 hypothetical protein [Staphylococcus epidermidis]MDS0940264.1 hypothetical protein [Staphylococcus epidermidis]